MADWKNLPYPIVAKTLKLLPIADVLKIVNICPEWKTCFVNMKKSMKIDASTPYSGRWQTYNASRDEDEKIAADILTFIDNIVAITDSIENVFLDSNLINRSGVEKLLSSQKAVKSLMIRYPRNFRHEERPEDGSGFTASEVGNAIVEGMIKHQNSLERINIGVEDFSISFDVLVKAFKDKSACFPNLKSVELLSTTAGSYSSYEVDEQFKANELKQAKIFFDKIFVGSKIEEFNFKPLLEMKLYDDGPEVFWDAPYIQLIRQYFSHGVFANLRKINIDCLNSRGTMGEFSEEDADLLIQNCPHITHIDSNVLFHSINYYREPVEDERPVIKLINHYGSQLVYLNCYISTNIAICISENCPNVKKLTIVDHFNNGLTDSALMALSCLKNMKKMKIHSERSLLTTEGIVQFLQKTLTGLSNLCMDFCERFLDIEIMRTIATNGENLKKVYLKFQCVRSEEFYQDMMECFLLFLKNCVNVRSLVFIANIYRGRSLASDIYYKYVDSCVDVIVSSHKELTYLQLYPILELSDSQKQLLREGKPNCRLEFLGRPKCPVPR